MKIYNTQHPRLGSLRTAVTFLFGESIPAQPDRHFDHLAPVKATLSVSINASASIVWRLLTAIEQWPVWQTDISKTSAPTPLQVQSQFTWKSKGVRIRSTLHTVDHEQLLGWTGKAIGTRALHNWYLSKVDDKTVLFVEESMDGLLPRHFSKAFQRNLENGLENWCRLLKAEAEAQAGV